MTRLSAADLRAALSLVERLAEVPGPDEFAAATATGLGGLVRCDFVSYVETNPGERRARLFTDPREASYTGVEEAFARTVREHPVAAYYARTGTGPALKMSDFLSQRQFLGSGLYDELFRPVDGRYVLSVGLPVPAGLVVGFGLVRSSRDFSERDRLLLELLRPHLAGAYGRSIVRAALGSVEQAVERRDEAVILLGHGRILYATPRADELLERWFGIPSAGPGLPAPVVEWLAAGSAEPLTVGRDGAMLRLDRLPGRLPALALAERRVAPSVDALRGLGLTRRETEVLSLAAEGRANAEIGRMLGVSPRTAQKHLDGVYRKLGVHTRTAAAAVALRAD